MWRFKTGGQWREMPKEFGARPTVHKRFRQWRDAGVFDVLLEGLIPEAARRGRWTCPSFVTDDRPDRIAAKGW
jgi:transposase